VTVLYDKRNQEKVATMNQVLPKLLLDAATDAKFNQIINGTPATASRQLFAPGAVSKNPKVDVMERAT
jgi:hypothetical protein